MSRRRRAAGNSATRHLWCVQVYIDLMLLLYALLNYTADTKWIISTIVI
jgi:hypothetical protein